MLLCLLTIAWKLDGLARTLLEVGHTCMHACMCHPLAARQSTGPGGTLVPCFRAPCAVTYRTWHCMLCCCGPVATPLVVCCSLCTSCVGCLLCGLQWGQRRVVYVVASVLCLVLVMVLCLELLRSISCDLFCGGFCLPVFALNGC